MEEPVIAPEARQMVRRFTHPITEFLHTEASSGIFLLAAAAAALVWANAAADAYEGVWTTELTLGAGPLHITEDLRHWINDGLMAIFFFVVGLEIKREIAAGELRELRKAALPMVAAVGGMVVPALLYVALNAGTAAGRGWGIPMATDIAFAVGVLAVLGRRIPRNLKVLLLSVAIADDIGAIMVIALFYSSSITWGWLAAAALAVALVALLAHKRLPGPSALWMVIYLLLGFVAWASTLESGVHATMAGVALGFAIKARPFGDAPPDGQDEPDPEPSMAERLENLLHPYSSFLVLPLFALANAGVSLAGTTVRDVVGSSVVLGIAGGLVIGKLAGITAFAWIAVKVGAGRLPEGVGWQGVLVIAAIAGIGFTVSLFITGLAFDHAALVTEAKVGVLLGSVVAATIGAVLAVRLLPADAAVRSP